LRVQRVVHARGHAVVADLGRPPEGNQLRAPAGAERGRPVEVESGEAIPDERVDARAEPAVEADVEAVVVEGLRALRNVVVARPVHAAGRVGQGYELKDLEGLRREARAGDDVARELRPASRRAAGGIVDVHAVGAEVAVARGGVGYGQQLRSALAAARALVVGEEEPLVLLD